MKEQVWKNSLFFILIGLAAIDAASVSGRSKWSDWSNDNMAGNSIRHECPNGMPVGTITWFEQGGWGAPHRINDLYIVCGSFNYNSPTFRFTNNWMGASSGAKICEGGFSDIQGKGEPGNALVNVRMMCLYGRRSWYDATRNFGGSWNNRLSCDGGYITGFEVREVAGHGIVNFRVLCGGNRQPDPVDGGYSDFGAWSECSAKCGGGEQTKTRTCTNPAPAHGGADCKGKSTKTRKCNTHGCAVDGGYSGFGDWSKCSAKCGGGTQTRSRTCTNPAPSNGGADCVGASSETRKCNTQGCPVDGGYSGFGDWSKCSAECGGGTQTRSRTCTNPAPANGGADCVGASSETRKCNTQGCSVDGGYSDFGDWSKCSAECGGGTQTRSRTCTNPVPANGGADCVGPSSEIRKCNTRGCITNGGYSDFGDWSECSAECGGGTQTRSRTCTNPTPANGGADCAGLGPSSENRKCNAQGCPVDGGYSDFGDWSECSAECGGGTQTRSRTCTNPTPANGGADCAGASSEERDCNTERCVSLIIKPHGETELQCSVGKWNCKPTFIVKKTKGEKVNPDDVKICKLVNGNVRDCREPRAVPGDKYLLRSGQVVASYAGAYVVVYTEDGVQHVSDPVTVTLV